MFLCLLAGFMTACSGINAHQGISPASFLIPGLLKNEAHPQAPDDSLPAALSDTNQFARL